MIVYRLKHNRVTSLLEAEQYKDWYRISYTYMYIFDVFVLLCLYYQFSADSYDLLSPSVQGSFITTPAICWLMLTYQCCNPQLYRDHISIPNYHNRIQQSASCKYFDDILCQWKVVHKMSIKNTSMSMFYIMWFDLTLLNWLYLRMFYHSVLGNWSGLRKTIYVFVAHCIWCYTSNAIPPFYEYCKHFMCRIYLHFISFP